MDEHTLLLSFMGQIRPVLLAKPLSWYTVNPCNGVQPVDRSGHRIVSDDDGNIYVYGGYNSDIERISQEIGDDVDWKHNKPLFREIWKFNFAKLEWEKLKTKGHFPQYLASSNAVFYENKIITFGGTCEPFGRKNSNEIQILNLSNKTWLSGFVDKKNSIEPPKMYGQGVVLGDDLSFYTVGGTTGTEFNMDVYKFDPSTKIWKQLSKTTHDFISPEGRYRHEVVLHNNCLLVFGGGASIISDYVSFGFENIPAFDLSTNEWKLIRTLPDGKSGHPKARKCHSCVKYKDCVYMVGGNDGDFLSEFVFGDFWKLELSNFKWTELSNIPRPLFFHSACVSPFGLMSIFGGTSLDGKRSRMLFSTFLEIPSLCELSWMSLLNNFRHALVKCSKEELYRIGIPLNLISRLKSL